MIYEDSERLADEAHGRWLAEMRAELEQDTAEDRLAQDLYEIERAERLEAGE